MHSGHIRRTTDQIDLKHAPWHTYASEHADTPDDIQPVGKNVANNTGPRQRRIFIDLRHQCLEQQSQKGTIYISHVPTDDQQVDILTKPLRRQAFTPPLPNQQLTNQPPADFETVAPSTGGASSEPSKCHHRNSYASAAMRAIRARVAHEWHNDQLTSLASGLRILRLSL